MNHSSATPMRSRIPVPTKEFVCRGLLASLLALLAFQFRWEGLRFLTSEIVLRLSAWLGMTTARLAFDTIELHGQLFQFTVSCTFVELFLACLSLMWRRDQTILANLPRLCAAAIALFSLNILRLEVGQIASRHGTPWIPAHDIPLGIAYFAVWVVVWKRRNWQAWQQNKAAMPQPASFDSGRTYPCSGARESASIAQRG